MMMHISDVGKYMPKYLNTCFLFHRFVCQSPIRTIIRIKECQYREAKVFTFEPVGLQCLCYTNVDLQIRHQIISAKQAKDRGFHSHV